MYESIYVLSIIKGKAVLNYKSTKLLYEAKTSSFFGLSLIVLSIEKLR